jgi:histidinol dehydrogenase
MEIIERPDEEALGRLLSRPASKAVEQERSVLEVLDQVRKGGDRTVLRYTHFFDWVSLESSRVPRQEFQEARDSLPEDLRKAIERSASNIERFHKANAPSDGEPVETSPGVRCWERRLPIDRVGLYIPGGSAPLFSTALMLGVPATLAECPEIAVCTPPDANGKANPTVLATLDILGIEKVFKIGGAQAVGALAYGTEEVPRVDKIFGPGNSFVTLAKQLVQKEGVAIDLPAGPSELMVVADDSADPRYIAADLLSQAEHGADSQVLLISDSKALLEKVRSEMEERVEELPRRDVAKAALDHSRGIRTQHMGAAIELANRYAPEHLLIDAEDEEKLAGQVRNAGSVFLGAYSPEAAGDYASGTNHTLPTNGHARAYSGVSVESFCKRISFQRLSAKGIQGLGPTIVRQAEAEGLDAHKNAVQVRLDDLSKG